MENLKTQLAENLDVANWEWLMPHVERDVLVIVVPELDLLEVGEAIASDNVNFVQRWISEQQMTKPSPEQIAEWNQNTAKKFNALIVSPYVLVQEQSN
ncbi:DUF2288 domain-containing protein [Kamptonema sp. UHCC 0994]|uniref:DUF2288 domain-containing protein n=1 Tax=Kamptonema sp. UHCC 0994 TaxID=3031329 RepID=UPI0023B8CA96|nr:DUF2288 domain-containing protein [Kamptonema sp. UHCC 0994]MDF0554724.1 DUF2288 domain-containing protein [Kamptonema sp. UHCC 0994]